MAQRGRLATARGKGQIMVTFDPHPLVVLRPEAAPRQLMDVEERIDGALRLGLDGVVVLPFTRELAATSAEDFVRHGLVDALGVRAVIVGSNFCCGRAGHGDIDYLRAAGEWHGFEVEALDLLRVRDRVCSSTEVRRLLAEGRYDMAAELLGRRSA